MAVETILFIDNLVDESIAASSIVSASATDDGYHRDNVRRTDFGTAWKAMDSFTANSEIVLDLGSISALGASGATAYFVVAYDPRGSNQANVHLQVNTNDDADFTDEVGVLSMAIPDFTEPTSNWASFTVPTPAKRFYRIKQAFADGDKRLRIFAWGMYAAAGVTRVGVDYVSDTTGPGAFRQRARISSIEALGGQGYVNRVARPQQEVEMRFDPGSAALWEAVRDKLHGLDGSARAVFAQFDGLRNPAKPDFGMLRMTGPAAGFRTDRDQQELAVRFVTEPCFGGLSLIADELMLFEDDVF